LAAPLQLPFRQISCLAGTLTSLHSPVKDQANVTIVYTVTSLRFCFAVTDQTCPARPGEGQVAGQARSFAAIRQRQTQQPCSRISQHSASRYNRRRRRDISQGANIGSIPPLDVVCPPREGGVIACDTRHTAICPLSPDLSPCFECHVA